MSAVRTRTWRFKIGAPWSRYSASSMLGVIVGILPHAPYRLPGRLSFVNNVPWDDN